MRVKITVLLELTLQMFDAKSRCALLCYAIVCLARKQFYTQNGRTIEHPKYSLNGNQHM